MDKTGDDDRVVKFTLRISKELADELDFRCREGQSRQGLIVEILENHVEGYDPRLCLGFFKLVGGEVGKDAPCAMCGYAIGDNGVWCAVAADGTVSGPFCAGCATTE